MKNISFYMLTLLIAAQLVESAFAQSSMANKPTTIPLKAGQNPNVQVGALTVEPVNLFIQTKPWTNSSPHVQLQLNVTNNRNNDKSSTFLWYYHNGKVNYPKVLGSHTYSLEVNNGKVSLVTEKVSLGKDFFIELGSNAIFEDLTILFQECVIGNNIDVHGQYNGYTCDYDLLMSNGEKEERLSINTTEQDEGKELQAEWEGYTILVLQHSDRYLKLRISLKD